MSELPNGWAAVTLNDIGRWSSGGTPRKGNPGYYGGEIPWVRTGDLRDNEIYDVEGRITPEGLANSSAKKFPAGTLLVAMYGATIGRTGLLRIPATTNQACAALLPDPVTDDMMPFLWWFFRHKVDDFRSVGQGGAQPNISQTVIKATGIDLPPLPEQRRIVAKLDRLSARSAAARDHLAHTTKLATRAKQAILSEAFGGRLTEEWRTATNAQFPWTQRSIGEIAQIVTGNTPPTKNKANYGDEHPFVKPGDLDKGVISTTESHLSSEGYAIARQLPVDTVLVSCIGNLGKIGILAREGSCNQQINALLPSADLLPRYTYWWAHTIRPWLEENSSATTVSIINKGRFSLAPISIPSIDEQAKIVRRIEAAFARIDRLTEEASRAAHLLDRLDERLLAKAFRGELVPQNPEDEPAEALLARIRQARAAAPKPKRGRRNHA